MSEKIINPEISSKSNEFIKQFPPVRDKIIQKLKEIFPVWQENDLAQLNQETKLEFSLLLPILNKADQMYISGLPETTVKIPEKRKNIWSKD